MIQLFLEEPMIDGVELEIFSNERITLLERLESAIQSVISSGCQSEARMWLCNTLSCISLISSYDQCELFLNLLRSKPPKRDLAGQVIQMILEKKPGILGPLISKKSYILQKFFDGNPKRILQWFDNFSGAREIGHQKGARAISQFAFVNRDMCWDELEWKGKHGQSPAMVATKPHYFLDLDVLRTVENFLKHVPNFWSSDELFDSVKDGEIFLLDAQFFVDEFVDLMYKKNSSDVWEIVHRFLAEEKFSLLCQRLIILFKKSDLWNFIISIQKISPSIVRSSSHQSWWLEILLHKFDDLGSINDLILLNAVVNHGRELVRLMNDEENEEENEKIKNLFIETTKNSSKYDHWALMKECSKKKLASVKWLGLQSWLFQYILSKECKTLEQWESLFTMNGINFQKPNQYSLVQFDSSAGESGSDMDGLSDRTCRKRKVRNSKKRRKRSNYRDKDGEDVLMDVGSPSRGRTLQLTNESWLLSVDDYSCSWNSADLPEYLSGKCFSTWMKWVSCKWDFCV